MTFRCPNCAHQLRFVEDTSIALFERGLVLAECKECRFTFRPFTPADKEFLTEIRVSYE